VECAGHARMSPRDKPLTECSMKNLLFNPPFSSCFNSFLTCFEVEYSLPFSYLSLFYLIGSLRFSFQTTFSTYQRLFHRSEQTKLPSIFFFFYVSCSNWMNSTRPFYDNTIKVFKNKLGKESSLISSRHPSPDNSCLLQLGIQLFPFRNSVLFLKGLSPIHW
jgi:hypothetical protein